MARHAEDLALGISAMAGQDHRDSTSLDLPGAEGLAGCAPLPLKGLKIGYFAGPDPKALHPSVKERMDSAMETLCSHGAEILQIDLPGTSMALETYCLLNTAEASSNLSRFDGARCGGPQMGDLPRAMAKVRSALLGREAKRRILLGTFCLSKGHFDAYFLKALHARSAITKSMAAAMQTVDFIATPVSPIPAFPLGEKTADPLEMYMMDILTVLPALADMPALAVPAGLADGLPVGIQLLGPRLSDSRLLRLGRAFQQVTDHHLLEPQGPLAEPMSLASGSIDGKP
jgi:aspartyl-tRNA(Asn)/glutamyl-tRNA(Gln) amidotransferase subunit A